MSDFKAIDFINCICCGSTINNIDYKKQDLLKNQMWGGGVVEKMSVGYGSKHDGDMYYIGVCDDCITLNLNNGRLIYQDNYMHPGFGYDESEKKVFEKKRNRERVFNTLKEL